MLIDGQQVSSFYDAVVGPAFRSHCIRIPPEDLRIQQSRDAAMEITSLFPWLIDDTDGEASGRKHGIIVRPDGSPARQLTSLGLHYLARHPDRVFFHAGTKLQLLTHDVTGRFPRIIAFIDAGKWTKFLPLAAEFQDGRTVTFGRQLAQELKGGGAYPETFKDARARDQWVGWLAARWDEIQPESVIEAAVHASGRPRWVTYRAWLDGGDKVDLTVAGHEQYDAAVFASNLVQRGYEQGLRIVGTVKSGLAINVMAIYEK